jgi:cell division protein FtsW (lipid II flippase)
MVIGMMPVMGIPLPFMSYGGTSLLFNMVLAGLLLNANRTQKML